MSAMNPTQRTPTGLPPYFRRYELPWSPAEEMERRFRVILRNLVIALAIIAVLIWFLPHRTVVQNTESLPNSGRSGASAYRMPRATSIGTVTRR